MDNVLAFAKPTLADKTADTAQKGYEAALECYIPGLRARLEDAWIHDLPFLIESYHCPPDDPLYQLACQRAYRNGVIKALKETFQMKALVYGPEHSHFIRVGVYKSRLSFVLLWLVLWTFHWQDVRTARRAPAG